MYKQNLSKPIYPRVKVKKISGLAKKLLVGTPGGCPYCPRKLPFCGFPKRYTTYSVF